MIKALFFAQLAEQAGCASVDVEFQGELSARDLVGRLEPMIAPAAIETLRFDVVMLSVNQKLADWDDELSDGDEVGFLPPFSGG